VDKRLVDVNSEGVLVGLAAGDTEIVAQWNGLRRSAPLRVVALPLPAPEMFGIPRSWTRVGSLYRFLPAVTKLNGGLVHLETNATGAEIDPSSGALTWRPQETGEYRFKITATNLEATQTFFEFTVHVEPRIEIAIDEILADPPPGIAGDANRDGIRDGSEDEFVELVNLGDHPVLMEGWSLSDDDVSMGSRFRFPTGVMLKPGERLVLFGGGTPRDIQGQVFIDDGRIGNGLTNSNERVLLIDPSIMDTIAMAEYVVKGDMDQSLVREGDGWIGHMEPPGLDSYSPGAIRRIEETPLEVVQDSIIALEEIVVEEESDYQEANTDTTISRPRPTGIRISELMANPASGAQGDTNGDGRRDTYEDEFVEFWNASTDTAFLEGWHIGDDDTNFGRYFAFPDSTMVLPGGFLTLFGGGEPMGVPGNTLVDDGRIGDGLSNSGDRLLVLSHDGMDTLDSVSYVMGKPGVSWVRLSNGDLVPHNQLPFHGTSTPGLPSMEMIEISLVPNRLVLQVGDEGSMSAIVRYSDGVEESNNHGVQWWVSDTTLVVMSVPGEVLTMERGIVEVMAGFGEHVSNTVQVEVIKEPDLQEENVELSVVSKDSIEVSLPEDWTETSSYTGEDDPEMADLAVDSAVVNLPPKFTSTPNTEAFEGLRYSYEVSVEDPDDDTLNLSLLFAPGWIGVAGHLLSGIPRKEDIGEERITIAASDGTEQATQSFRLQVQSQDTIYATSPDTTAQVGLTWRYHLNVRPNLDVQVDGGPHYREHLGAVVWRPAIEDMGHRLVSISVSGIGPEDRVTSFQVSVREGPLLQVSEILIDPPVDVDGDGTVDKYADQFLELANRGKDGLDLSGWTLGDDDGHPFEFPANTFLPSGARIVLTGDGEGDARTGWYSAGGKIGNGLAASDRILLISPFGPDTVISVSYSGGNIQASLVPDPRRPGKWQSHASLTGVAISPGLSLQEFIKADTLTEADLFLGDDVEELDLHGEPPFPNPFSGFTKIALDEGSKGSVRVFNVLGQMVRDLSRDIGSTGASHLVWDGRDNLGRRVGSGVYLIQLNGPAKMRTMRVVFMR
jgi:hypothetical protein